MKTETEAKQNPVVGEEFKARTGVVWKWVEEKSHRGKWQAQMVGGCTVCHSPDRICEASDIHQVKYCTKCVASLGHTSPEMLEAKKQLKKQIALDKAKKIALKKIAKIKADIRGRLESIVAHSIGSGHKISSDMASRARSLGVNVPDELINGSFNEKLGDEQQDY